MKKGDLDNVISFDKINEDKPGEVGLATKNYRSIYAGNSINYYGFHWTSEFCLMMIIFLVLVN